MFRAPDADNYEEFIELYNLGEQWVSLSGYRLGDQLEQDSLITVAGSSFMLAPGGFALVLDPGYWANSSIYDTLMSPEALLLTISDNSFGAYGLRNDPPDTVILLNASADTISAFTYTPDNERGYSEEKIRLSWADDSSNWGNSLTYLGTPGFGNSLQPPDLDLALVNFTAQPDPLPLNSPLTLHAWFVNSGMDIISTCNAVFALGELQTVIPDTILWTSSLPAIAAADSAEVTVTVSSLPAGPHRIFAWHTLQDSVPENDSLNVILPGGYPAESLIINEFMAHPSPGEGEWMELYHPGQESVNLLDFTLSDQDTSDRSVLADTSTLLYPGDFVLLAKDSSIYDFSLPESLLVIILGSQWPVLNDNGDTPYLFDAAGAIQDAVPYSSWEIPIGISLERLYAEMPSDDPQNWQPSVDSSGATPGRANSVMPQNFDLALLNLQAEPSPLPLNSPLTLIALCKNAGLEAVPAAELIFASAILETAEPDTVLGVVYLPPLAVADSATAVLTVEAFPPGSHRIFARHSLLDSLPENDSLSIILPGGYPYKSLIINEIMPKPAAGKGEWVELVNPGQESVNLLGFAFSDQDTSDRVVLTDSSAPVNPGDFVLLAQDSSIFDYALPADLLLIVLGSQWPALNNDGDTPTLWDAAGSFQDAVSYAGWDIPTGVSLERIYPDSPSDDPQNWQASQHPAGATPGMANSVLPPPESELPTANLSFSPDPFDPELHGSLKITIVMPGEANSASVTAFDLRGRRLKLIFEGEVPVSPYEILWNGRDENDRRIPPGLYILFAKFLDGNGNRKAVSKKTLVIAGKL